MAHRNTTKLASASVAFALSLGLAQTSEAEVFTASYTGTVSDGNDQTGLFGAPNTALTGDAFTAVYTVNDANGSLYDDTGAVSYTVGGSGSGYNSPVSATISINGRTVSIGGNYGGEAYQAVAATNGVAEVYHYAEDYSQDNLGNFTENLIQNSIYSSVDPFTTNSDLRGPLSHTVQPTDVVAGYVLFETYANGVYTQSTFAELSSTEVTIGTPEPSVWALMLLGVGAVGFGARRRRTALALS